MDTSFNPIINGFLLRFTVMLVIFFMNGIDPKIKVAILFLLDAVDCGYTQIVNYKSIGNFSPNYCNEPLYLIGDEILDYISYIMAYKLLGFSKYLFIFVIFRIIATILFIISGNKWWFMIAPDAFKELVMYSWIYPLNHVNIIVICAIKLAVEYYYL